MIIQDLYLPAATLLDISLKAACVILLTIAFDWFCRDRSAALRHWLWLTSLLALLLLPVMTWMLPSYQVAILPTAWSKMVATANAALIENTAGDLGASGGRKVFDDRFGEQDNSRRQRVSASITHAGDTSPATSRKDSGSAANDSNRTMITTTRLKGIGNAYEAIAWVGLGGTTLMLVCLFAGVLRCYQYGRRAVPVEDLDLQTWLRQQCLQLGIKRRVGLRQIEIKIIPMTWGICRPVILLPAVTLRSWSDQQLRSVLLHELAHVKRQDVLTQILARVALSLYWFHPLVWYGYRRLRCERELACDDRVLLSGHRPSDYAQQLLNIARDFRFASNTVSVGMAHRSGLEQRVRAILNQARSRHPLSPRSLGVTVTMFTILAIFVSIPTLSAVSTLGPQAGLVATARDSIDLINTAANELAGTIVDEEGNPLADVSVDVWSWYPGHETVTDVNGRFRLRFDQLERPDQKVEVCFRKEGFSPHYNAQQELGRKDFKVTLNKRTLIEGVVQDAAGKPVPNVEVRGEHGPHQADGVMIGFVVDSTTTDAQGHYRLYVHPESYRILARSSDGQVARVDNLQVAKNEAKQLNLDLQPGVRFVAKVLDSVTKEPFAGLVLWHFMHPGSIGTSDANGELVINGLSPGDFKFNVGEGDPQQFGPFAGYLPRTIGRWWSPAAKHPYERESIVDGQFQRNLDDLTFDLNVNMEAITIFVEPGVIFKGRVIAPNGDPVEGATVAPAKTGSGNSLTGDTRFSVKTDANGQFTSVMPAGKGVQYNLVAHDGEYRQWRTWANGVTSAFDSQPGELIDNITIQLTPPATVRGKVVATDGQSLAGREVRAHAEDLLENRYYDPTTRVAEDGTFELKFIRPGVHHIQVEPFYLNAAEAPPGSTMLLDLQPGEVKQGVELKLPATSG
ncbi:M56 family metallopeptidase [Planctomycetaceae bacterium SH139]